MVWAFQRSLAGKFSNLDDEAAFQPKQYENIDPETAKSIIASTSCPNHAMHDISTLLNCLTIFSLEGIRLIRISCRLRIPTDDSNLSSHIPLLHYTPIILSVY